jgi:hypothetical protein
MQQVLSPLWPGSPDFSSTSLFPSCISLQCNPGKRLFYFRGGQQLGEAKCFAQDSPQRQEEVQGSWPPGQRSFTMGHFPLSPRTQHLSNSGKTSNLLNLLKLSHTGQPKDLAVSSRGIQHGKFSILAGVRIRKVASD